MKAANRKDPIVTARETYTVGEEVAIQAPAEEPPYSVVFEDDGETGYLYALDNKRKGNPIVDAMLIYNAAQITDRHKPCLLEVVWSGDSLVSVLFINRHPHAVVDFGARRACCRTGFPPPRDDWTSSDHMWDDKLLEKLGL